jgi:hypothetical protein
MEKQFSRAGKTEAGGAKVMSVQLFNSVSSRRSRQNPIPSLKKKHSEFCSANFANLWVLITRLYRSARQKNLSNKGDARLILSGGNNRENSHPVTTSQLFQPNDRRSAASLLPIRLPIPNVLILNCPRPLRSRARLPGLHQKQYL